MNETPTYDSASPRTPVLFEARELYRYRHLLALLVANISKSRYKRSALGVLWTLLNPLLNMLVLSFAFSQLFRFSLDRYPVYVLIGLVFWNFFSQVTTHAMTTLVWGGSLLKRIYLPRAIFAASSVGNGLVNLGLSLIPLALIVAIERQPIGPAALFFPVAVLLLAMFALGVALFMSALAVLFVDIVDMYSVLIQMLFFLTPIMFPLEIVPERFRWLVHVNPLYHLLRLFRDPLYLGTIPPAATILAAALSALLMLLLGSWFFTRKADELAYRV